MLARMLLHVIGAPCRIDLAMNRPRRNWVPDDVKDGSRIILDAVHQSHTVDRPQIVRLAARCRIERRAIQNDSSPAVDDPGLENVGVEFKQVWVVIVEAFSLHETRSSSPSMAGREHDEHKAAA